MTPRQQQFARDGFVLERVLTDGEVEEYRWLMAELLDPTAQTAATEVACSSMQHLGDPLESFGTRAKQYYIHMLGSMRATSILHAYHIPAVLTVVEELLGPQPIINNASIFATNPGVSYSLGWHRDVIQIPQAEIRDELFSPDWPHNSVQINLPLYEEQSLWVVPGSHRRPNTPEENAAFGGSKHYAPLDAVMPGGVPVKIPAGHALLYNNNLIHRGYNAGMETPHASRPGTSIYCLSSRFPTPPTKLAYSRRFGGWSRTTSRCGSDSPAWKRRGNRAGRVRLPSRS
jgi:ectoine hydroxylase-related dioxygenase (phytanoyl-CoA dioxygenase family)